MNGFFNNKTVLVTGAGGFIGSHLVEALVAEGAQVRAMVKYNSQNNWGHLEQLPQETQDKLEVIVGDITDPYFVDKAVEGCHTVFHLAALIGIPYSYIAPQHYVSVNVNGTLNVLEACRRHKVSKLVHTSTSETYGTAQYTPIDEKHPLQGQSPYSASKIAADKLAESYHCSFDLPVATIRPFNTFGPRQSARAVIPTIISQALKQNDVKLGALSPVRDFTFVKDTAQGFIAVAKADASIGQVTNVGSNRTITIGETAELILKLMNKDLPIICAEERVRPDNSEVFVLQCDNTKALETLDWRPQYSFEDGLKETITAIEATLGQYKTHLYNV